MRNDAPTNDRPTVAAVDLPEQPKTLAGSSAFSILPEQGNSDNPRKCTRRLITLTDEAEADLQFSSESMRINHSLTIREALRIYAQKLRESGRCPMTTAALDLGGELTAITPPEAGNNDR
jgi:hypothetical protein